MIPTAPAEKRESSDVSPRQKTLHDGKDTHAIGSFALVAPSGASCTIPIAAVRETFRMLDQEFFDSANGVEAEAECAAKKMSDDGKLQAIMAMYRLLHRATCIDSSVSSTETTEEVLASSQSMSISNLTLRDPAKELSGQLFVASTDLISRTPSMMSAGGASLVSMGRPPVQLTDVGKKEIDVESGHKKINEYVILGELGRGTQGKVKLAYDTTRNQLRAIKIIRRPPSIARLGVGSKPATEERRKRIEQEIAITKRLRHKNLVALYEVIDDPEQEKLYLVFQHIGDGPMGKMKDQFCKSYDEAHCLSFARQMSAGLAYLHDHGVVHRDIKPDNVLVGEDDHVYFIDFGVSEMMGELQGEPDQLEGSDKWTRRRFDVDKKVNVHGSRGTPAFWPPELIQVNETDHEVNELVEHDGFLVDVWALGVTLFAIMCGRLPWICLDKDVPDTDARRFRFQLRQYFDHLCSSPPMFPPQASLLNPEAAEILKREYDFEERSEALPKQWVELFEFILVVDPKKRPSIHAVRKRLKAIRQPMLSGVGFRRTSSDVQPKPQEAECSTNEEPLKHIPNSPTQGRDHPQLEPPHGLEELASHSECSPLDGSPTFALRHRRRTKQWSEDE